MFNFLSAPLFLCVSLAILVLLLFLSRACLGKIGAVSSSDKGRIQKRLPLLLLTKLTPKAAAAVCQTVVVFRLFRR